MNTIRQSEIGIQAKAEVPAEDTDRLEQSDLYYHGIIRRLSPRKGTGVVRTASGRDVRFSYQMVLMSGPLRSPKGLREGMVVGYDVGWGGHGLRVTKIRTYPQTDGGRPAFMEQASPSTAANKSHDAE